MGTARKAVVVLAVLFAAAAREAAAASLAVEPDRDNVMSQDDTSYASGAGSFLFFGAIASGGARRSLVRFDLAPIPPGSTVSEVSLRFRISKSAPQSGNDPMTLHRVTADWGEGTSDGGTGGGLTQATPGDATWDHRFYGNPPGVPRVFWSAPGGDFVSSPSASTTVGGAGTYTVPTSAGLVADVQAWVNEPSSNHGWIMRGNETDSQTARRIFGRTAFSPADRPLLTVEYTPPNGGGGPPGAQVPIPGFAAAVLAVFLAAGGILAQARRTSRRS